MRYDSDRRIPLKSLLGKDLSKALLPVLECFAQEQIAPPAEAKSLQTPAGKRADDSATY